MVFTNTNVQIHIYRIHVGYTVQIQTNSVQDIYNVIGDKLIWLYYLFLKQQITKQLYVHLACHRRAKNSLKIGQCKMSYKCFDNLRKYIRIIFDRQ